MRLRSRSNAPTPATGTRSFEARSSALRRAASSLVSTDVDNFRGLFAHVLIHEGPCVAVEVHVALRIVLLNRFAKARTAGSEEVGAGRERVHREGIVTAGAKAFGEGGIESDDESTPDRGEIVRFQRCSWCQGPRPVGRFACRELNEARCYRMRVESDLDEDQVKSWRRACSERTHCVLSEDADSWIDHLGAQLYDADGAR